MEDTTRRRTEQIAADLVRVDTCLAADKTDRVGELRRQAKDLEARLLLALGVLDQSRSEGLRPEDRRLIATRLEEITRDMRQLEVAIGGLPEASDPTYRDAATAGIERAVRRMNALRSNLGDLTDGA